MCPHDLRDRLLHLLLPRTCLSCREDLPYPLRGPLCGPCLASLRPLGGRVCTRCGAPWEGPEACCPACRRRLFPVDAVRAVFPYTNAMRALVHAFKYRGDLGTGRVLGAWMASGRPLRSELRRPHALVPVPLHPSRERERGFNQARLLAEAVSRTCHAPVLDLLIRTRRTVPQTRLRSAARRDGQRGAFRARPGIPLRGMRLLLIDDVRTTGGTLEACGEGLRRAGAADVRAYVLAAAIRGPAASSTRGRLPAWAWASRPALPPV